MGFLDSVVIPKGSPQTNAPTGGSFLSSVVMPTASVNPQSGLRQSTTPPSSSMGFHENPQGSGYPLLKDDNTQVTPQVDNRSPFLRGTQEGYKQATAQAPEVPSVLNIKNTLSAGWQSLKDTLKDSVDRFETYNKTASDSHSSALQKGVALGEAGMGALNTIFSPVTASLSALSTVPVVGHVANKVNEVFSALGNGGSETAKSAVDKLPLSQTTKDAIKPLVSEIGALIPQLIAGKLGVDILPKISSKSKEVLNLVHDEVAQNIPQVKGGFLDSVQLPETTKPSVESQNAPKTIEIPKPIETLTTQETLQGKPEQGKSKVGSSVETKAIEKGLAESFGDTAGYDKITIKDQAERASKAMEDIENATKMVKGEISIEPGLRPEALIKAMEDHAEKTGDVNLLRDIAQSPLVSETSVHAQAMRLLAERNPDSVVTKLREIKQARETQFEKKTGKKVAKAVKDEVKEIKNSIPKIKKQTWSEFVDTVKCGY